MADINESLRRDLLQPEFSEGYAEAFQDAYTATQIKVLREQNNWTQAQLAERLETTQTAISRIESVNYSAWNISTLKKLARAFRVRLKVSFETYGSLIDEVADFNRESLCRVPRERDTQLRNASPKKGNLFYGSTVAVMPTSPTETDEEEFVHNPKGIGVQSGVKQYQQERKSAASASQSVFQESIPA